MTTKELLKLLAKEMRWVTEEWPDGPNKRVITKWADILENIVKDWPLNMI